MITCEVHHEASDRERAITQQIEENAPELADVVEKVTGLPLPDLVVIRVMDRTSLLSAATAHLERLLISQIKEHDPTSEEIQRARVRLSTAIRVQRATWIAVLGMTVLSEDEVPQMLVSAPAMRHAGGGELPLVLVAHEPVHFAQEQARPGLIKQRGSLIGHSDTVSAPDLHAWMEGHAAWAGEQRTMQEFLGRRVRTGRRSLRRRAFDRTLGVLMRPRMRPVRQRVQFFQQIWQLTGSTEDINRAWTVPALMASNLCQDPQAWLQHARTASPG